MHLADEIHQGFHYVGQPDGEPMEPVDTLITWTGVCRDTGVGSSMHYLVDVRSAVSLEDL